jgi:hypothetical protein
VTSRQLTPVDEEASAPPLFLPAAMEAPTDAPPKKRARRDGRPADDPAQVIELEVDGVTVRFEHGARAKTIADHRGLSRIHSVSRAAQAATADAFSDVQFQGNNSSGFCAGRTAKRASTSASQAWASTSSIFAVTIRLYMARPARRRDRNPRTTMTFFRGLFRAGLSPRRCCLGKLCHRRESAQTMTSNFGRGDIGRRL